jgi:dihydroorotate dehydrogenase electron transfer subunit
MTGCLPPAACRNPQFAVRRPQSAVVGPSQDTTVVERQVLAPGIVSVWLEAELVAARIEPGQFVQVRISPGDEPFLRRPFSVAQQRLNRIRIVFRTVGRGTTALGQTGPGDKWNLFGPLGKPAPLFNNHEVVLVGGGIGIAPLLFLAERICRKNRVHVLLGARTRQEVILRPEFRELGPKLSFSTDDGSLGARGLVTDALADALRRARRAQRPTGAGRQTPFSLVVFACGPRPMLKRVKELTRGLESYAFWEERMGCGTGICYGCAVKRANGKGYLRFCQEGPVLRMSDIEI